MASRPPVIPYQENRLAWDDPVLGGASAGIIMSNGPYWKEQRRFTLRNLRDFGFGKTSREDVIMAEATKLCDAYKEQYAGKGASS